MSYSSFSAISFSFSFSSNFLLSFSRYPPFLYFILHLSHDLLFFFPLYILSPYSSFLASLKMFSFLLYLSFSFLLFILYHTLVIPSPYFFALFLFQLFFLHPSRGLSSLSYFIFLHSVPFLILSLFPTLSHSSYYSFSAFSFFSPSLVTFLCLFLRDLSFFFFFLSIFPSPLLL